MFWVLLSVLIVGFLFWCARPMTIHEKRGPYTTRYVIVNNLTGNYCFDGRLFRSEKTALKKLKRLDNTVASFGAIFSLRQVNSISAK